MDKILNSVGLTIILFATILVIIILYLTPLSVRDIVSPPVVDTRIQLESDTLSIFTYPNYFSGKLIEQFKQREDLTIKIQYYENNEELLEGLLSGGNFDIIVPTDYMVNQLRLLGLIEPIRKELIPNYRNLDIRFREMEYDYGNQYSIPYFWGAIGLNYDQNHVMNLPLTWASILDTTKVAHLRNKISILDDARMSLGIVLIAMGLDPNTTNEVEVIRAADLLIHLSPYIGLIQSEYLEEPLINGDIHVAMNWSGSSAKVASLNSDFRFVLPAEGSIFFVDNFAIPVNSKSKILAHMFINFLLEPRIAAEITNNNFYPNPVTASRRYIDRIILKGPAYINPFLAANNHVIRDLGDHEGLYNREWNRFRNYHDQYNHRSNQVRRDRGRILLF
jgi:spermidine/putrescine transport system substrate-binding protein